MSDQKPTTDEDEQLSMSDILDMWADEYNNRIPVEENDRRNALAELIENCAAHGYDKRKYFDQSFQTLVLQTCVPQGYHKAKEKRIWEEITKKIIRQAVLRFFNKGQIKTLSEENRRKAPEKSTYVKSERSGSEEKNWQPVDGERFGEELDRSKLPKVEVTPMVDEDVFLKDLGLDE